jgi:hypothetical protein
MKKKLLLVLLLSACVFAQDYELISVRDARIWSAEPDSSYGTEPWLAIQGGQGSLDITRALIRFDLDELPYTEDIVAEALLKMWVLPDTDYTAGHAGIYMTAGIWDETVTWNTAPLEDRSITGIGVLPPHSSLWFEQDITDIVHSWLYLDAENNGLYVEVPDATPYAFPLFASREYPQDQYRPRLAIYYSTQVRENSRMDAYDLRISPISSGKIDIHFSLPHALRVSCKVYDVSGKLAGTILEGKTPSGEYSLTWDCTQAGIYFAVLSTPEGITTERFLLIK